MDFYRVRECLKEAKLQPSLLSTCLKITDVLDGLGGGQGRFLTLSYISQAVNDDKTVPELFAALNLLSTFECAILDAHGYLIDEDGEPITLSEKDFAELISTGELAHPETGEMVPEPMSEVRLYYSLCDDGSVDA